MIDSKKSRNQLTAKVGDEYCFPCKRNTTCMTKNFGFTKVCNSELIFHVMVILMNLGINATLFQSDKELFIY